VKIKHQKPNIFRKKVRGGWQQQKENEERPKDLREKDL
jgi:hypothetical protein